jgi:lysophospholipid acyltransferase (LPLAT)-like uncharacterized protein
MTGDESKTAVSVARFSTGRRLLHALGPPVLDGLLRVYWRSCRVMRVTGVEHLDALEAEERPLIFCFWHQRQLFTIRYLLQRYGDSGRLAFLVSPSKDGELGARLVQRLGGRAIRGSANRTGAQALRDLYLSVARDRLMPVLTPDGSQCPARVFKPGAVMLARLSGAAIVPMSYAARRAWYARSWCRFMIPKPFTRVAVAVGEPLRCERGRPFGEVDPALLERLGRALDEAQHQAEAALGQT